jgi:two-component system cell cycle sensor histidine kinase/response regulator CckA
MTPRVPSYPPTDQDILHALVDDLPVGLWVARAPSGAFVYANRQFEQIMGMPARSDVAVGEYSAPYGIRTRDGQPYPEARMPFVRALAERQIVVVDDLTIHRGDGTTVDVRAFARPVIAGDEVTHVVIAFFDITREVAAERARAESEQRLQLTQRMEAIGTLAGGIAHDFNNLILGIKLLASQLALDEDNPSRRQALAMIDDVTDRASELSRSLLGFARRGKHRSAPIAFNAVTAAMVDMLRRTITGITITAELRADEAATVVGDRSQIEQVIMNLVVNARDALADADAGRIAIRTASTPAGLVLEVADNGPGIPPAIRPRVFEPYFTTKDQGPGHGTGLGLATVFGIVDTHGGRIEIADGLDGRGTTMRVTLPAGPPLPAVDPPTVRLPPARPGPAGAGRAGTILVVDDDDMVRRALQLSLSSLGYKVMSASNGTAAVELYTEHRTRIRGVLLDMVMPGMGGRATYLALRAVDAAVPVILISGYAMNEEVQAILDLGVLGFLQKPCSIEALGAALDECLPIG